MSPQNEKEPTNTGIRVPHSGEQVFREFDNTPLEKALDEGLVGPAPYDTSSILETGEIRIVPAPETAAEASKSKKNLLIYGGAGLAAVAIGAGVFAMNNNSPESNNNTQTQTQPSPAETAQAPVVAPETDPSADPTNPANLPEVAPGADPESLVNINEFPTNVVEHGMFALLTPEQQGQIRNMESLSVEQFRALDEAQQFQFAEFVYRNNLPILKNRLDMMGKSNVYLDANLDTPEGLLADSILTYTLISSLDTKTPEDGTIFDSVTAQKLSILKATRTDELGVLITNAIDADIATINVNTPPVILEGVLQGSYVDVAAGTTINNVFDTASETNVQSTFKVFDRVTVEGNPIKDAQMIMSVREGDSRYIQNLK